MKQNNIKIAKELIKIAKQIIDKTTEFFKSLKKYKVINGFQVYQSINKKFYYQFDDVHGHWQKFNKNGKHVGVADQNGQMIGFAIQGRKINVR